MTLVAAWIRRVGKLEELVIASDSRLTGGIALSHAPKLFPLQRNDAVLAYCGPTVVAYPILLQVKASLDGHDETRDRLIDIVDLKSHIEKAIEGLRTQIQDLPSGDGTKTAFKFLLAGYSWKFSRFRAWTFKYDILKKEFNAFSMPRSRYEFEFMSDERENELTAKRRLQDLLRLRSKTPAASLNWEPLQVLFSFIQDPEQDDIGGPPQILKIYKHANVMPINVLWPEDTWNDGLRIRKYSINHLGRPLLDYERTRRLTLDPKAGEIVEHWNVREYAKAYNECEERRLSNRLRAKIAALLERRKSNLLLQSKLKAMVVSGASLSEMNEEMKNWQKVSGILSPNRAVDADDLSVGFSRLQAAGQL